MTRPRLSLVILTRNEEDNIGSCLSSVAGQTTQEIEVIVIDAASTDATVERAEAAREGFPMDLHLVAHDRPISIGHARNLGVELARAPVVAFLSADAELDETWAAQALRSLKVADLVFGRQVHDPHDWTLGAAVRGLRYRFPDHPVDDPDRLASNVAAAYRKRVLETMPFDPSINAAEDLLIAQRARSAGYKTTYNPHMVVFHHDVATLREEMRKNVREGWGLGVHARELGVEASLLGWGVALVGAAALLLSTPVWPLAAPVGAVSLAGLLWLPALRRATRHAGRMPLASLVAGVAASPAFDLAFLANYVHGLTSSDRPLPPTPEELEP